MKRLLLITIALILTTWLQAQDTKPSGLLTIQSPGFYYYQTDSSVWIYKGSVYGWTKLASKRMLNHSIDSLSNLGYKKIDVDNLLLGKVDKVTGKGLSTADVTSAEKTAIAHSNRTALDLVSGTNTGNDATNSQYSGLAASKINVTEKGIVNGVATLDDNCL